MPRTTTARDSAPGTGRLPALGSIRMGAGQHDFEGERLLDGLEGDQRAERLALLEYLAADGASLSELRRATESGTLMFLPAERVIGGRARYTLAQAVELSGIEREFLLGLRAAMGLPLPQADEPIYTEEDVQAMRTNVAIARRAGIADEDIIDMTRTLGRGLAQGAETMRALVLKLVLEPGLSEPELARRYADAVAGLA